MVRGGVGVCRGGRGALILVAERKEPRLSAGLSTWGLDYLVVGFDLIYLVFDFLQALDDSI